MANLIMSNVTKKIKQIFGKYPEIMDDVKAGLKKSKIDFTAKGSAEIKAQASRKKVAEIICSIPNIEIKDVPILLDIVGTKKDVTYIRLRCK